MENPGRYFDSRSRKYYDLGNYTSLDKMTVMPVFGNGLVAKSMSNLPFYQPDIHVIVQQQKLKRMIDYYNSYINEGKLFGSDDYVTRFISGLNFQLLGYLGGKTYLEETHSDYPFWDHLSASKKYFSKDIMKLAGIISKWEIKGNLITTNRKLGSDSSFRVDGKSLEFFNVLKLLNGIPLDSEYIPCGAVNTASFRFGIEAAASFFGTYPYESVLGFNIDAVNQTFWEPDKTAEIIIESLKDENSISRVLKLLEKTKKNRDISVYEIEADREKSCADGGIKKISYIKKTEIKSDFIQKSERQNRYAVSYINYDLKVMDTGRLENYAVEIPLKQIYTIENFIETTKTVLRQEVPFRIHAEFFIMEGPVTVEKRIVYPDPIVICIFREFPGTYIPVEAWLPDQNKLLKMHEASMDQGKMINNFDAKMLLMPEKANAWESIWRTNKFYPVGILPPL